MLNKQRQFFLVRPLHHVVTPYSLTLCLAYIHHYTPSALPTRRFPPLHLRCLARWIGAPNPQLRSVRTHPALAAHLALLYGADLMTTSGRTFVVAPAATSWLHLPSDEQITRFLALLANSTRWEQTLSDLNLQEVLPCDYTGYVQQTLLRLLKESVNGEQSVVNSGEKRFERIEWLHEASNDVWKFQLPDTLPGWLLFDLLQLGEWAPGEALCCTPVSLVTAVRRGYSPHHIRWLLETGTGRPLPEKRVKELEEWVKRGGTYRVRTVQLLSTCQPTQLKEILGQRRWRPHFQEQIGPRHALIGTDLIPHLQEWLAAKGYVLDGADQTTERQSDKVTADASGYSWLGLRILIGLGEIIPLPYPPPYQELEALGKELTPLQQSELEAIANSVLEHLRTAVRGRDAFWPPETPVAPERLAQITQAIEREQPLHILYQSLGEWKPSYRRIQPLRLVEQGGLHYLYAYCYRTETNLVFRVDRIHEIITSV